MQKARSAGLDVLVALGQYDFTGLSVFNGTIDGGPNNALGLLFSDMTISVLEPATALLILPSAMLALRLRRRK